MERYEPRRYWQTLLAGNRTEQAVGWPELSLAFNRWQYRARGAAIRRLVPDAAGLRVLDVGSGIGRWVAHWRSLGAAEVSGLDLVEASVEHLKARFPGSTFTQADIAEAPPLGGPFDLISAIDVLLHIVEDDRYASALANLRRAARLGTRLVLLEPVSVGPPVTYEAGSSSRVRGLAEVRRALVQAGWELWRVQPATWLFSNPVETHPAALCRDLWIFWFKLKPLVRAEVPGWLCGAALYPADRLLCRLPWGPSSKVLVAVAR